MLLACLRQTRLLRPYWRQTVVLLAPGPLEMAVREAGAAVVVVPLPGTIAAVGDTQLRKRGKFRTLVSLATRGVLSLPQLVRFQAQVRRTLRDLEPTIVHSHGLKSHLVSFVTPRSAALLWHIHDFYSARPVVGKLLRRVRSRVRLGIAIAPAVATDAATVLPGLPLRTILNAVDTDHFTPGPPRPAHVPLRLGLVATYANWKGHTAFLQALARMQEPVQGVIIGGPIYATAGSQVTRLELEQLAAKLQIEKRVEYVPFQADPCEAYRSLDVVIHASTRPEPFGLTIAEAMSCGKPVVIAAGGGAKDLFTEGVDALGHPPGDVEALAGVLDRLVRDAALREQLGIAARQSASARFALPHFGAELMQLYEQVTHVG
ncbi:MAG: glycosyltransferase family 4 protein [Gemmataceae bacterium]